MKKDTSKLIDLDSILNPKVEETKQPEIISESVITTPEVQLESIDVDAILSEWAWRCDKGYPEYDNISDRLKLQEILDEIGIELPFDRITEAKLGAAGKSLMLKLANPKLNISLITAHSSCISFLTKTFKQVFNDVFH